MAVWEAPFFKYVVRGSFNRADTLASTTGAIGLAIVAHIIGVEGRNMLSADDFTRSIQIAVAAFFAIWIVIIICRACWWPFYWRLEPHGGLGAFLRARLETFMWPVVLTVAGVLAFILLSGAGLILLSLQALNGAPLPKTAETPNTVGNPDFVLLPPVGRYKFQWDPAKTTRIDVRLDTNRNPALTNNAAFILRNKTNTVAYNIAAVWKSETATSLEDLIKSPKLSKFKFNTDSSGTQFTVFAAEGSFAMPMTYYLEDSPTQIIPVVAKEAEVFFPPALLPVTGLYLITKMPSKLGDTSDPFILRISLNWETSDGKKQRDYRLRVSATNAKATDADMPVAEGFLNFSLEEIGR